MNQNPEYLEANLKNFSHEERRDALDLLLKLNKKGMIQTLPENDDINMHCHTFFSYNAYGHSPSSLVWLARKMGWRLLGIVDFDTLAGVDELFEAASKANIRATAGIETRVYISQFSNREINSPGEPGVAYHMGLGFSSSRVLKQAELTIEDLHKRADSRNSIIVDRLNNYFEDIVVDYTKDVLPLSPSQTPTERHIILAYINAVEKSIPKINEFWARKLQLSLDTIDILVKDLAKFQNQIRSILIKRGGPGYIQPTPETFPDIKEFHQLIIDCGALPTFAWLDGISKGEQDIEELLTLLIDNGVVAVNIIPDRNWNISDPEIKKTKINNLYNFIELAKSLDLPINVGTEMNSFGNKIVDNFLAPELQPYHQSFLDGAFFTYGHTRLQQIAEIGYQSSWAKSYLPTRKQRNGFYTTVGKLISPINSIYQGSSQVIQNLSPDEVIEKLKRT
jgi:hypothetical protein